MMNRLAAALLLAWTLLLTGCGTQLKMALRDDEEKLTPVSKPVYLMTATLKNNYRTSFQPELFTVHVERSGGKESSDKLNFTVDGRAKQESDSPKVGNSYFLRMQLDPGRYEIRGLSSMGRSFPIIGFYFTPLHLPLETGTSGVFYLGHVTATIRERQGSEFKAGATLPLIDQAIAGASGGSFDVEISDRLATDEAAFRSQFPALAGVEIKRAILPPFDRAKAQQWWEAH
jgi:hypothetical protein